MTITTMDKKYQLVTPSIYREKMQRESFGPSKTKSLKFEDKLPLTQALYTGRKALHLEYITDFLQV